MFTWQKNPMDGGVEEPLMSDLGDVKRRYIVLAYTSAYLIHPSFIHLSIQLSFLPAQ